MNLFVRHLLFSFSGKKILLPTFYLLVSIVLFSQTSEEKFGQNRVQYKNYIFQYYESDNFTTYFYQGGQDVAKYVIKTAEDVSDEIATLLDFKYRRKIDIIVYNNINELNQTNIGIYEQGQNPGGTTKIPENKLFVYNNGDHRFLDRQVREGIARIYLEKMVLGSNFAELIQNAVMLNLPDWYKLGLIEYIGKDWDSDMEDRLRDGILTGRYKKLNKLEPAEAVFVGHSIWHYIEEVHGKAAVSNVIYLTRVNRSVDNGFLFVLGTNLSETLQQWYTYYSNRFYAEKKITSLPSDSVAVKTKLKKDHRYYQPRLCPDGKHIAYAGNDMGRYKVYVMNTETGKRKVVFRGGFRTNTLFTDESLPLIAWEPSGKRLAILSDRRAQTFLRFYDLEKKKMEVNPVRKFQKVISFSFVDSKQLVMSAIQNGQTDIFLYNIASTTTKRITDDYYDDLYPAYIAADSMRGIMFSSNRPDADLKPVRYESQVMNKNLDLFFYDLDASRLYRITSTPNADETFPQNFSNEYFSFLSDANGIRNRYIGYFENIFDHHLKTYIYRDKETGELDSVSMHESVPADSLLELSEVSIVDSTFEKVYVTGGVTAAYTNMQRGIKEQSVVAAKGLTLDMVIKGNRPRFYKYPLTQNEATAAIPQTDYVVQKQKREQSSGEKQAAQKETDKPQTVPGYENDKSTKGNRPFDFQSEFDYGIKLFDWDSAAASRINNAQEGYVFRFSRVRPYFVRFMVDKVITQIDNNLMMTRYQPFDPSVPQFNLAPVSFMFKLGITDLLENHKVYGGLSLPFAGTGGGNQYFLTYENLTKRLDYKLTFYRRSQGGIAYDKLPFSDLTVGNNAPVEYSIKTNYAEVEVKYPLDVLNAFRFGLAFRNDRVVYKAKDAFSLNLPSVTDNWLFLRAEYVFDNCMEVMTNIRYGTRFKVFAEIHKQFPTKNKEIGSQTDIPLVQFNNKYLGVIGFDLRHYQKVHRQIIWANRLAMGASFGNARLIYYMGGLDNWITSFNFDKFDRTTPINTGNNYAFQTLATPLRGFKQNARNGDKYIVLNSELRVPVFSALIRQPIRSEIIRNFQLVAFFDVGTAWEGASPFSDNNPLFNEEIPNTSQNPSVIVRVKRYKTPVIFGFGPGVRTTFLSYFFRFDTAWGFDTGELSQKPMYYFTFGTDF